MSKEKDKQADASVAATEEETMKKLSIIINLWNRSRITSNDALKCVHDIIDRKL